MTEMMLIVCHSEIPVNKIYWFKLIQGVGFSLGGKWGVERESLKEGRRLNGISGLKAFMDFEI